MNIKKIRFYILSALVLIVAIIYIIFIINSSPKDKIIFEVDLPQDDKDKIVNTILANDRQRENLNNSNSLNLNNQGMDFCDKSFEEKVTGQFQSNNYGNLSVVLIKNNNIWSICNQGTAP